MHTNIIEYGASTELSNNAPAIQKAIDTCSSSGGGRVTIPTGRFVTGTIYLRDNVELYLEHGAVLKATDDLSLYNELDAYPENYQWAPEGWNYKHLIIAAHVTNVAVTGTGKIEGCAESFFDTPRYWSHFWWRYGIANTIGKDEGKLRPGQLMVFVESTHVRVVDITITDATCWCVFFHGCSYVQVHGVKIFNSRVHANTDGIDIDSSKYVTVSDCIIDTGDDCIAIRGSAARLQDKTKTCEYITITNCVLACSADAFRIGVGTGAISHVRVSNIVIERAATAIDFNTSYGGNGHCELDDINFAHISAKGLSYGIMLVTGDVPISRVTIEDLRAEVIAHSMVHAGTVGAFTDVTLRGIDFFVKPMEVPLTDEIRRERGDVVLACRNIVGLRTEGIRVFFTADVKDVWKEDIVVVNCTETVL